MPSRTLEIPSTDDWFKVVGMLQQNWALIAPNDDGSVTTFFISDASGVFDRLSFATLADAMAVLARNGFAPLAEDEEAQDFIHPPAPPFRERRYPNGPIYSSGRFWR
jgi:hypothetical protein